MIVSENAVEQGQGGSNAILGDRAKLHAENELGRDVPSGQSGGATTVTRVSTFLTNVVGDNLDAVRPGTMSFTLLRQTRCGRRWDAADEAGVESDPSAQDWSRCW